MLYIDKAKCSSFYYTYFVGLCAGLQVLASGAEICGTNVL